MAFQKTLNMYNAVAIQGDYANNNPRASLVPPAWDFVGDVAASGFIAADNGVIIGNFAWIQTGGYTLSSAPPSGITTKPDGFISRDQVALITDYLGTSTMTIEKGLNVDAKTSGDYWVKPATGTATRGHKAFASLTDGSIRSAASGSTIAGFVDSGWEFKSSCAAGELAIIGK